MHYSHTKNNTMKVCNTCKVEKFLEEFSFRKQSTGIRQSQCKSCIAKDTFENRFEHRKRVMEWYKNNPRKYREHNLKKLYGITLDQFNEILNKQNNLCAICKTNTPTGPGKQWVVDHCHEKDHVRGILCSNCNKGLGFFKDNSQFLQKAIYYLESR